MLKAPGAELYQNACGLLNEEKIFCSHQCSPEFSVNKFRAYISTYILIYKELFFKKAIAKTSNKIVVFFLINLWNDTIGLKFYYVTTLYILSYKKIIKQEHYSSKYVETKTETRRKEENNEDQII